MKVARLGAVALVVTLAAAALSGCSSSMASSTTASADAGNVLTMPLPTDVTASGVIAAAVILRAGSIEEAVANGTVTPAEVDLARQAVADGTLKLWAQRAQADLK
jgi:hypothetical protein